MVSYQEKENYVIRNNEDESISFIPKDLGNSDYQQYLEWQAKDSLTN